MSRGTRRWGGSLGVLGAVVGVTLGAPSEAGVGAPEAPAQATRTVRMTVDAVAYHLPGKTASGLPCARGVVAVDPNLIPLGTQIHVPGYGRAIAADVGTAIKGRIIDLWMQTDAAARKWGRRTVKITVYR